MMNVHVILYYAETVIYGTSKFSKIFDKFISIKCPNGAAMRICDTKWPFSLYMQVSMWSMNNVLCLQWTSFVHVVYACNVLYL